MGSFSQEALDVRAVRMHTEGKMDTLCWIAFPIDHWRSGNKLNRLVGSCLGKLDMQSRWIALQTDLKEVEVQERDMMWTLGSSEVLRCLMNTYLWSIGYYVSGQDIHQQVRSWWKFLQEECKHASRHTE